MSTTMLYMKTCLNFLNLQIQSLLSSILPSSVTCEENAKLTQLANTTKEGWFTAITLSCFVKIVFSKARGYGGTPQPTRPASRATSSSPCQALLIWSLLCCTCHFPAAVPAPTGCCFFGLYHARCSGIQLPFPHRILAFKWSSLGSPKHAEKTSKVCLLTDLNTSLDVLPDDHHFTN